MGIDVVIWVNKKEVLDKIEEFEFWELMFNLSALNGIRYYRLQELLGNDITSLHKNSREDINNNWVLKRGLLNLERKKDYTIINLLYLFKNLNEFELVPDESNYKNNKLISVANLIEEFENKIKKC